ncbi:hypothetical protein FA13DRAFT_1732093 [Coprinellus micaceus]|uniref:Uncharacterized protein n=1 Tax=Coprinellus micaceus TaxID=71717 RepID=A0A4Y7TCR3_COPMI|nr:hypothetical protein FA13DRAFT_1732093 [Coprinellus micaceus]
MQSPRNDVFLRVNENRSGSKRPGVDGQLTSQGAAKRRRRMPTSGPVSPSDGHPEAGGGGCASSNPTLDNDRLQRDDGSSGSYGKSQDSNTEKPGDYLTRSQVIAALALYGKQESEEDSATCMAPSLKKCSRAWRRITSLEQ